MAEIITLAADMSAPFVSDWIPIYGDGRSSAQIHWTGVVGSGGTIYVDATNAIRDDIPGLYAPIMTRTVTGANNDGDTLLIDITRFYAQFRIRYEPGSTTDGSLTIVVKN